MADEIKVNVYRRSDHKCLYLRYTDPVTGGRIEKSSGCTTKKEAAKAAGRWEAELRAGGGLGTNAKTDWDVFRAAYEQHVEQENKEATLEKVWSLFNVIESLMPKPDKTGRITRAWITRFRTTLLENDREPSSVESHCRHLKAAINWGHENGYVRAVPKFPKPSKRARVRKKMKGRPIAGEEFDRYLAAVETHFRTASANRRRLGEKPADIELTEKDRIRIDSLQYLMRGLWLSGLRLGESLCLTWDEWADGIRIDASGRFVKLLIFAEDEKGGQDRIYPVTPDFQEFLLAVPESERQGFVFNPYLHRGVSRRVDTVSSKLIEIGETAKIKVDEKKGEPVYVSAHDLRRSFGTRWAKRGVSVFHLKELMRHSSVKTTEQYYVDIQADETAEAVLQKFRESKGATSGATHEKAGPDESSDPAKRLKK